MDVRLDYRAMPAQWRFHRNPASVVLFRGGVGSGKTTAGAAEAVMLALQNPGCDGMIVGPTWSVLQRTTLRTFRALFPQKLIVSENRGGRYIEIVGGGHIYYGAASRPETLEGSTLAWVWGDEARYWPRSAYEVLLARVRDPRARRRRVALTSTPSMNWLYSEFGGGIPDRGDILAPTWANHYLPDDYMARMQRTYSPRLYRQYVGGEWVLLEGSVYEEFDELAHIIPPADYDVPVEVWVDPGYRRPSVLYVAILDDDTAVVVGESQPSNVTVSQLLDIIDEEYRKHGWARGKAIMDPAGKQRSQQVGWTVADAFHMRGWRVEAPSTLAQRDIPAGVEVVRSRLVSHDGHHSLFFSAALQDTPSRRSVLRSLRGYRYKDDGGDMPLKDGLYDHAMDALRYGCVVHWPPDRYDTIGLL